MVQEITRRGTPRAVRGGQNTVVVQRRGHALVWVAVVLALGLGAWGYFSMQSSPADVGVDDTTRLNTGVDESGGSADPNLAGSEAGPGDERVDITGPQSVGTIQVSGPHAGIAVTKSFEGQGSIAGTVRVEGAEMPEVWTVTIEPSIFGTGREHAETRVIECEPRMREFQARDLPLGGYRVSVAAEGLVSRATEVTLYKVVGLDINPHINVDLILRPMATVDGTVRAANGDVADGIPMFLVSRTPIKADEVTLEAVTDNAGIYRFEAVEKGAWLLVTGDPLRSLTPSRPLAIGRKHMQLDEVQLPALAAIDVVVFDEFGRPFPSVEVTGYLRGNGKGTFRAKTDGVGHLTQRYLTPGPWRLDANYKPEGYAGRTDVKIDANETPLVVEIVVKETKK